MANNTSLARRPSKGRAARIVLVALLALSAAALPSLSQEPKAPKAPAEVPQVPAAPQVPSVPQVPVVPDVPGFGGRYELAAGKTHEGNLRLLTGETVIAGKQIGDVWILGGSLDVSGEVTGKVRFFGSNLTISGKVGKDVQVRGGSFVLTGRVEQDLDATAGSVSLQPGSFVGGDAEIRGGQLAASGAIVGDLDATCGQISFDGTVDGDASLHADVLTVSDKAKVKGNLTHESRVEPQFDERAIVDGAVDRAVARHVREESSSLAARIALWFGLTLVAILAGLGALAIFRGSRERVIASIAQDPLRNAGVGFLTVIVVPVALLISCILLVTIPFAVILLVLFFLLLCVADVPVAVWLGRFVLAKAGKPQVSVYTALLVGTPILYVLYFAPVCFGWLFVFVTRFFGMGAIVFGTRDWWQARKAAKAAAAYAAMAPQPPPPAPPAPGDPAGA